MPYSEEGTTYYPFAYLRTGARHFVALADQTDGQFYLFLAATSFAAYQVEGSIQCRSSAPAPASRPSPGTRVAVAPPPVPSADPRAGAP